MSEALRAEHRLATYGTLAPGEPNHHHLSRLKGRWLTGAVRGRLVELGWGAAQGYPAIILDSRADPVRVHVFESADLPGHWPRLDAFEGNEYVRVVVSVALDAGGEVDAMIFAAKD
ncbi:MAG: gamma-glutamylcyclotransferase family protein [Pseudomonadota bacterium]